MSHARRFERWARSKDYDVSKDKTGTYRRCVTRCMWAAWEEQDKRIALLLSNLTEQTKKDWLTPSVSEKV